MFNPWVLLTLLGLWVGSIAGAGWIAYGAGQDKCIAEQVRDVEVANIAIEAATRASAEAIAKIKVQNRTITNEVTREVIDRPVYRNVDCSHSPEQLRRLNSAITGEGPEPAGGLKLPEADASLWSKFRGNDPQADRDRGAIPGMPASGVGP